MGGCVAARTRAIAPPRSRTWARNSQSKRSKYPFCESRLAEVDLSFPHARRTNGRPPVHPSRGSAAAGGRFQPVVDEQGFG
jgi:hypothetical protein